MPIVEVGEANDFIDTIDERRPQIEFPAHLKDMPVALRGPLTAADITFYILAVQGNPLIALEVLKAWSMVPPKRGKISSKEAIGIWDVAVEQLAALVVITLLKQAQVTGRVDIIMIIERFISPLGKRIVQELTVLQARARIQQEIDGALQWAYRVWTARDESHLPLSQHFLVFEGIRNGIKITVEKDDCSLRTEIEALYTAVLQKLFEICRATHATAQGRFTGTERVDFGKVINASAARVCSAPEVPCHAKFIANMGTLPPPPEA